MILRTALIPKARRVYMTEGPGCTSSVTYRLPTGTPEPPLSPKVIGGKSMQKLSPAIILQPRLSNSSGINNKMLDP